MGVLRSRLLARPMSVGGAGRMAWSLSRSKFASVRIMWPALPGDEEKQIEDSLNSPVKGCVACPSTFDVSWRWASLRPLGASASTCAP